MIRSILHTSWLSLRRDPMALVLTFALPIVFFSIFAAVFGAMDEPGARAIPTRVANQDDHPLSLELESQLKKAPGLRILEAEAGTETMAEEARRAVAGGRAAAAVVVPAGFGVALLQGSETPVVEILTDRSNPMASGVVRGLLKGMILRLGLQALAPGQTLRAQAPVREVDVLGRTTKRPSIAFFASGLGVMFLMFSAAGRSSILIEERESGILRRLLVAQVGLGRLLLARWLFLTLLGTVQLGIMFAWAAFVFGLELLPTARLLTCLAVTLPTAAAAAAFGLLLATLCRTRTQLTSLASVLVLILSALGGSLFPRFLMPEGLADLGRLTFNGWALEAYQKVFWYDASVTELLPHLAVLTVFCALLLGLARSLAGCWRLS